MSTYYANGARIDVEHHKRSKQFQTRVYVDKNAFDDRLWAEKFLDDDDVASTFHRSPTAADAAKCALADALGIFPPPGPGRAGTMGKYLDQVVVLNVRPEAGSSFKSHRTRSQSRHRGGGGAILGLGHLPQNSLEQYPSGRWGFVGSVDARLGYVKEDGSLLDLHDDAEQIRIAREHGPRLARVQTRTFATAYDAMMAAKKLGQSVNVPPWMLDRHPDLSAALKRSKVKSIIR